MRNPISVFLLTVGIAFAVAGFILGLSFGKDEFGEFSLLSALYWWLSGIISSSVFIGLSEIINLLQKLLDKSVTNLKSVDVTNTGSNPMSYSNRDDDSVSERGQREVENRMEKINGLTILIDNQRFKGAFWINSTTLSVMKKSMFQTDAEAQLVTVINKKDLSSEFERDKDYFIFRFKDSDRSLGFKTHTICDYEVVVNLLKSLPEND